MQDITFAPHTLQVRFKSLDGHMKLDIGTVRSLELVYNLNTSHPKSKSKGSLFAVLNLCKTNGGGRKRRFLGFYAVSNVFVTVCSAFAPEQHSAAV